MGTRVVGLRIELEGESTDLKAVGQFADALEKIGKQSKKVEQLTTKIKELEKALKSVSDASKGDSGLPGGKEDEKKVKTLADLKKEMLALSKAGKPFDEIAKEAGKLKSELDSVNKAVKQQQVEFDQNKKSLSELRTEMQRLASEGKTFDELSKKAGELKAQAQLVNREIENQKQAFIAVSEQSGRYRKLNAQLVIARNTYKDLTEAQIKAGKDKGVLRTIEKLDTELKKIDAKIGQYQRNVGNYVNAFKGLRTIAFEFTALIGAAAGLDDIVQQNAEISDSISDVQKTTGLAKDEARLLSDALRKVDTRTTLDGLLGIAEGAGRLGLGDLGVEGLEKFAISVDKVNVALGDVLEGDPQQIATDLAKISSTFDLDDEFGAAGGIERIGAAINLLGSSTKANENFILKATKRIQGLTATVGFAAPEVLGLSATLDELAITNEAGTSAVSSFITRIAQTPEVFSDLVQSIGITKKEFQELAENSPNEALLKVLEATQSSEKGFNALSDVLEKTGINGVRQIQTITALSNNVDLLAKNQKIANSEFSKTQEEFEAQNSLYDEFNIKNQNLAASIDKAKNALVNFITQSGIQDFLQNVIQSFTTFFTLLTKIPEIIKENKAELVLLGIALITLNGQMILASANIIRLAVIQKAQTASTFALAVAQRALNLVMSLNPIGLVITAIALLGAAFIKIYKSSETFRNAMNDLWQQFVDLYEQNLLVKSLFFTTVEAIRFLIGIFTDFDGTIASTKERFKVFATQIGEALLRLGLKFSLFKLAVERSLTFTASGKSGIEKRLKEIQDQIKDSTERVEKAQSQLQKNELIRQAARAEASKKAEDERVAANADANNEIDSNEEDADRKRLERQKRLSDKVKKQREKDAQERLAAAIKIADLENDLTKNEFDRKEKKAVTGAGREVEGLTGSPEQIDKQTALIQEALRRQLEVINKERQDAQQKSIDLIVGFNKKIIDLQIAGGLSETEAEIGSVQRLFKIEDTQIDKEFSEARQTLVNQLDQNVLTYTEYERSVASLQQEQARKKLALINQRGSEELTLQTMLFQQQEFQLRTQLENELLLIRDNQIARQAALQGDFESGNINEAQLEEGTEANEEFAQEEQLLAEMEFEIRRQEQSQQLALQALEFETEMANRHVELVEDRNDKLIEAEKRRRDVSLELLGGLSETVGEFLSGEIENFDGFLKSVLLLTLDSLEKSVNAAIVQATVTSLAQPDSVTTFGASGLARAAIIGGLIKGAFAGIKSLIKKSSFEHGGDIGSAPSFEGNHVPKGGGYVQNGKMHIRGGIKGMAGGHPIEIQKKEFVMRNGGLTHIINARSTAKMLPALRSIQGAFSPNSYSPKRAALSRHINALSFEDGGTLPSGLKTPPLIAPVSVRSVVENAANASNLSSSTNSAVYSNLMIDMIESMNARIDRIQVINTPEDTVRQGELNIEVQNNQNQ